MGMIPRPAATGRIRHQTHLSPRHCGLFVFSVWQELAAWGMAKHEFFMA